MEEKNYIYLRDLVGFVQEVFLAPNYGYHFGFECTVGRNRGTTMISALFVS